ncbi:MAG: stage 0 sporulation protein, partial [Candidatus Latescibacterota bacterium]
KAKKEEEAFRACREKIAQHGLKMKLVDVEYQFDGKKITFYFTAEHRVDFRDLVRDLAKYFHTRVELRQIGVRDEAKWVGGYGPCGRRLCCAAFLREFESVSSQMAKLQNLCVSPDKISGLCGRLMCCLLFEREFYEEVARKFPKVGSKVSGEDGRVYEVSKVDIFRDRVYLKDEVGMEVQMSSEELSRWRRPLRRLLGRIRRRGDE